MNYNNQSTLILLFSCRCFVDCGKVVSASNKFRVTSECLNSPCIGSEYIWQLMRLNDDSKQLERIAILPNMTSTAINATNMIIKKKSLQSSSKYALNLTVIPPGGTAGFAVLEFETAGQPHSGYCVPSAVVGFSLETKFHLNALNGKIKINHYLTNFASETSQYPMAPLQNLFQQSYPLDHRKTIISCPSTLSLRMLLVWLL